MFVPGVLRGQEDMGYLELELPMTVTYLMCVLVSKLWASAKAAET